MQIPWWSNLEFLTFASNSNTKLHIPFVGNFKYAQIPGIGF